MFGRTKGNVSSTSPPFFGPASQAAAAFALPVHNKVRILEAFDIREDVVPEHGLAHWTVAVAEPWKISVASRKPAIRRSRSIASCTRRKVSSIPTGSSESRERSCFARGTADWERRKLRFGREAYFALVMQRRLWPGLQSFSSLSLKARFPHNRDVHERGRLRPLDVDFSRPLRTNSGHSRTAWRKGRVDP